MILKNNHFIWKIDPPSHRCRGTWIIRVLASKCPEIGMLPWFFIPIVEFIIQLLSKFTRISHFCTKKFQQGDIGWYICHLLLMWIFIWICPVLMSFVLVKFSRGVYRPLWPPSPMSIRQTMVGQSNKFCRFILLTWFHAEPLMNLHSAVEMVILRRVNFVADILYLCAPHYG